jgi:hypothetical protein
MNLIFLYDEFMRVPLGMEGNPVYIFDNTLSEGYELSEKIIENRYFLAKELAYIQKYHQVAGILSDKYPSIYLIFKTLTLLFFYPETR